MHQSTALDILKTGNNVFLTGSAGSGKTYTLNQYIHYLRARRVPVAVTASTGIAATHMSGVTIHSWSGIGIKDELSERDLSNLSRKRYLTERIKDTAVLIIDEISMLHAKQLDLVNTVLKHVRQSEAAFGGIQVVVAGDFFQLPPVGARTETNRDKFAFMSAAWLEADFHICYLTEQHRQDVADDSSGSEYGLTLDSILNQIRQQTITYDAIDALQATQMQDIKQNRTRLYTHKMNINQVNERELDALPGTPVKFSATTFGDDKLVETLKKNVRTCDELVLKVGAKVMFIKNNSELGVSNGSMGVVVDFKPLKADKPEGIKLPVIQLNDGDKVMAEAEEWVIEDENGEVLASYSQIPLALAWAITIHKSQGMTLEAAEIDLSKTFELGQGYVALSRLKSLSGLQLLGMNEMSLKLDPLARGADRRFHELSEEMVASHAKLDEDSLDKAHNNFILKSGGTLSQAVIESYEKIRKKRQERLKQQNEKKEKLGNQVTDKSSSTLLETRLLLEESLSIAEIAQARELSQATIMRHLSELKKQDPSLACEHLRPSDEVMTQVGTAYIAIKAANDPNDFDDKGNVKLKPIFDYLRERIDYNSIRLALIFIGP
ncbi:AAA family ATPase [Psychrobacter sp. I-STPA10]|uniref:AAA family ATPase n=1 Tax=Psychrobacter sp. I-STPA10 TaxID=2585769 RepID=UPI001E28708F|nr:AAA family ATPase [Psychrobacter sp. I-STPA10]